MAARMAATMIIYFGDDLFFEALTTVAVIDDGAQMGEGLGGGGLFHDGLLLFRG